MNILYDKPLLEFVDGIVNCNRPYHLANIEEDYSILKAAAFIETIKLEFDKP